MRRTFEELRFAMADADEPTLWKMLTEEKKGEARPYVMNLIYGKFSVLRTRRERAEMAQATAGK